MGSVDDRGDRPLEGYRDYLHLLARLQIGRSGLGAADLSDVVQQTLLLAHERRGQFLGTTHAERSAWLRTILARQLADVARRLGHPAAPRSLEDDVEASSARLEDWLASEESSPVERAERNERLIRLAGALAELPDEQRTALELRYFLGRSVPDTARAMDRSLASVSGLLRRGLMRLRELMDDPSPLE